MNQFIAYFTLELKKMKKTLFFLLLGTVGIGLILGAILWMCQLYTAREQEERTVRVGVAAKEDEPYLDWMIQLIENMDTREISCEFIRLSESEAEKQLLSGDINLVIKIPEDYIAALVWGKEVPLTIRFGSSDSSVVSLLMRQVGQAVSEYMTDTQAGLYAMNDYYRANHLPGQVEDERSLNKKYLSTLLGRKQLISAEYIRTGQSLSTAEYYFCAGLVLFFMLWGLICPRIFRPEPLALRDNLARQGIGPAKQSVARMAAFTLVFVCNYLLLALLFFIVLCFQGGTLPQMAPGGLTEWFVCLIRIIPVFFLVCPLIQLMYEMIADEIGSMLFLFLFILLLGYLSGCFYSFSNLPQGVQNIARFLPFRVLFVYIQDCLTGVFSGVSVLGVFLYSGALIALSILIKAKKKRDRSVRRRQEKHRRTRTCSKYILWFFSLTRRLVRRPLFLAALFLIPALVLGGRFMMKENDSYIKVALYFPSSTSLAQELKTKLLNSSSSAISFYPCESVDEVRQEVASGGAECGYIFPENLEELLSGEEVLGRPVLQSVCLKKESETLLIDEFVLSGMYEYLSIEMLKKHVEGNTGRQGGEELLSYYRRYRNAQTFILFEYADGSRNQILSQESANYMLLPVRGMVAILILATGLIGLLFLYEDKEQGLFIWLTPRETRRISSLYYIIPILLSGAVGLSAIVLTGLASEFANECLSCLLYLLLLAVFCRFLGLVLPRVEWVLGSIPLLTAASLIFCPVFINLADHIPGGVYLQKITPVYYYLYAVHSVRGKCILVAAAAVLSLLCFVVPKNPD